MGGRSRGSKDRKSISQPVDGNNRKLQLKIFATLLAGGRVHAGKAELTYRSFKIRGEEQLLVPDGETAVGTKVRDVVPVGNCSEGDSIPRYRHRIDRDLLRFQPEKAEQHQAKEAHRDNYLGQSETFPVKCGRDYHR